MNTVFLPPQPEPTTMRKKDMTEFMQVFEATREGLYRMFRPLGPDDSQAEDMMQECYMRLWEKWEEADDPISYVFGIAWHLVKGFHRQRIRLAIQYSVQEAIPDLPDLHTPDMAYLYKETQETIREILHALSPEKKAAFTLIKEEERSYKDASRLLGVPVSTLEKQLSGSIRLLRKSLLLWLLPFLF